MEFSGEILQWINTFTLAFLAFAFTKGWIVAKPTVDKMLEEAENRTTKVADEVKDGIKNAVREGIVEGIHEVRNGGKTTQAAD